MKIRAQMEKPGTKYKDLEFGAVYRKLDRDLVEQCSKRDRKVWMKNPDESNGDFYFERYGNKLLLQGVYAANRPRKDERVEFLGVFYFIIEDSNDSQL